MARAVWEFWVSVLKTDNVIQAEEMPDWDEMEDELQDRFVEAFSSQIVKPLRNYVEALEFDRSFDKAFEEARATLPIEERQFMCYICDARPVKRYGKICGVCFDSHVPVPDSYRRVRHG